MASTREQHLLLLRKFDLQMLCTCSQLLSINKILWKSHQQRLPDEKTCCKSLLSRTERKGVTYGWTHGQCSVAVGKLTVSDKLRRPSEQTSSSRLAVGLVGSE